jgi:hypothetical protein
LPHSEKRTSFFPVHHFIELLSKSLGTALLCFILSQCSAVTSKVPVGQKPFPITKKEDFEGTWRYQDFQKTPTRDFNLKVINAAEGILEATYTEPGTPEPIVERIHLMHGGHALFASKRALSQGEAGKPVMEDFYFWGRLFHSPDAMLLFLPHPAPFEKLIKAETLPGTMVKRPELGPLKEKHLELLGNSDRGDLYRYDIPILLLRVK